MAVIMAFKMATICFTLLRISLAIALRYKNKISIPMLNNTGRYMGCYQTTFKSPRKNDNMIHRTTGPYDDVLTIATKVNRKSCGRVSVRPLGECIFARHRKRVI